MTTNNDASDLHFFVSMQMRMSHIYQPVMIKALLERSGEATIEEIAKSLLAKLKKKKQTTFTNIEKFLIMRSV